MMFFHAAPDQIVVGAMVNPQDRGDHFPIIDIFYDEQLSPPIHMIIEEMVRQNAKPEILFLPQEETPFEIPQGSTYVIVTFRLKRIPPELFDSLSLNQFMSDHKRINLSQMQLVTIAESDFKNDDIKFFVDAFAKYQSCAVRVYEKNRERPLRNEPFEVNLIEQKLPQSVYR